jgi:hypothetical protein
MIETPADYRSFVFYQCFQSVLGGSGLVLLCSTFLESGFILLNRNCFHYLLYGVTLGKLRVRLSAISPLRCEDTAFILTQSGCQLNLKNFLNLKLLLQNNKTVKMLQCIMLTTEEEYTYRTISACFWKSATRHRNDQQQ